MSVQTIIQRRKTALLDDFCNNIFPPLLQVEGPHVLGQFSFLEEFSEDEQEVHLGRRAPGSVVIRQGPGNPDMSATLWVASSYSGYRNAYRAFIKHVYNVDMPKRALVGFDVDHLLNRARSAAGSAFLRVEAIESGTNRAWGSVFEKMASTNRIAKNRSERRLMSYAVAAKVMGLRPPSGPEDTTSIDAIAAALGGRGMNKDEVREGLRNMLGHVARNQ